MAGINSQNWRETTESWKQQLVSFEGINPVEDEKKQEEERVTTRLPQLLKQGCDLVRHAEDINHPEPLKVVIVEARDFCKRLHVFILVLYQPPLMLLQQVPAPQVSRHLECVK